LDDIERKIAILDIVGNRTGIDYYSLSLLRSISKLSVKAFLFTNYTTEESFEVYDFFSHKEGNVPHKTFRFVIGLVKTLLFCRQNGIKTIIIHIFHASYVELVETFFARIAGLKVVLIVHDLKSFVYTEQVWRRILIYEKFSDVLVVHNDFCRRNIVEELKNDSKVHIIKHGGYVDIVDEKISKWKARETMGLSHKRRYVLFFGMIKKNKGLDLVLQSFSRIDRSADLIIAGRTRKHSFARYQDIIESNNLGDRVIKMIRHINDDERELLFRAVDLLVLPYREVFQSGVLLMAMSYGLPVIASDLEPFRDVVQDRSNGLFFDGSAKDLAKKVNLLLDNRELSHKIGRGAVKTMTNDYSWDNIAKEYVKFLD